MTRSGAPTYWEMSLGKFCQVPECTSLAKHVVDGEYRCGRHTKSKKCPKYRRRAYTDGVRPEIT